MRLLAGLLGVGSEADHLEQEATGQDPGHFPARVLPFLAVVGN